MLTKKIDSFLKTTIEGQKENKTVKQNSKTKQ